MEFPTPEAIKNLRSAANLTIPEAADLVYVSPRTWISWEAGNRKMDPAYFELILTRLTTPSNNVLNSLGVEKVELTDKEKNMIVIVKRLSGNLQPIDVISQSNFIALEKKDNEHDVISSLAIERGTGKPYVHRTQFKRSDNNHVSKTIDSWKKEH